MTVAARFRECLQVITGEKPPEYFDPDLQDLWDEIQDWCCVNARPEWSTGIAIFEAAEKMVEEAISNGNLDDRGNLL